jgi:glycosyltransferase involved in cell wall biosynthesis
VNNQVFKPLADSGREGDLIGTMGRRVKMKGFWETTEALKMVALKGFRFRLRIITQEELPEFETQFPVELVKSANDEELAKNLGQCGLFISSSWFEGFGLPALEAMACGVPVITTDNGGCNEYARNSVNCLIVPPRRIDLLSQAIIKMRENPVLAAEFSHRGLETALKFDWDKTVDRVEEIIFRDLEGR